MRDKERRSSRLGEMLERFGEQQFGLGLARLLFLNAGTDTEGLAIVPVRILADNLFQLVQRLLQRRIVPPAQRLLHKLIADLHIGGISFHNLQQELSCALRTVGQGRGAGQAGPKLYSLRVGKPIDVLRQFPQPVDDLGIFTLHEILCIEQSLFDGVAQRLPRFLQQALVLVQSCALSARLMSACQRSDRVGDLAKAFFHKEVASARRFCARRSCPRTRRSGGVSGAVFFGGAE